MTLREFEATLAMANVPAGLPAALAALWHDAKGTGTRRIAWHRPSKDVDGAWVHA